MYRTVMLGGDVNRYVLGRLLKSIFKGIIQYKKDLYLIVHENERKLYMKVLKAVFCFMSI